MKVIIFVAMIIAVYGWTSVAPEQSVWGDMTLDEWSATHLMQIETDEDTTPPTYTGDVSDLYGHWNDELSLAFDWRQSPSKGHCISEVRDQGSCGSCWAFATAEVATDKWCWATDDTTKIFSPQHLMDCDTEEYGCLGAITQNVILWIARNEVILEEEYPYEMKEGTCRREGKKAYHMENERILEGSKAQIQTIVKDLLLTGPGYFSMQVMSDFMNYSGGVFYTKTGARRGGHAVEVVGFGLIPFWDEAFDASSVETMFYWICKNSWGKRWGENGYFKIRWDQMIAYNAGTFEAQVTDTEEGFSHRSY